MDAAGPRLFWCARNDRWHSLIKIRLAPTSGGKADMLGGQSRADIVAKVLLHW
jgi:hypothetical protein